MVRTLSLSLISVAVASSLAAAQPASVQAEALFRQGKSLMGEKKYAEACAAFESSQKIEPSVATLLNLADCREKNGQLATAWGHFLDAEKQTRAGADATSKAMNGTATKRGAALEAKLSKLTISVPAASQVAGLEVWRDATKLDPNTFNAALPIDGGTYKISARAAGHAEWTRSVTVKTEMDAQTIEIPRLEPATAAPPPPGDNGTMQQPPPESPETPPSSGGGRSLTMPIVFGASALVLGGVAFGFARSGDRIYDESKLEEDDAKQTALWKSANKRRYAAIGFGAAAVGCVGAAVFLYVRGGKSEQRSQTVLVEPVVGSDGGGLAISGAW